MLSAAVATAAAPAAAEPPAAAPAVSAPQPAPKSLRIFRSEMTPAPAERPALDVRVATARDFTRLEFHWLKGAPAMSARRDGRTLVLSFPRGAQPDLTRLRINPPRFVETAEARGGPRGLEIVLTLAEGADARAGRADGVGYVNIFAAGSAHAAASAPTATAQTTLAVGVAVKGAETVLTFPFARPLGAAVFRRGDAVWIVFDSEAGLDAARLSGRFAAANVRGPGYTALRITAPPSLGATAESAGGAWRVTLGPERPRPASVAVASDRQAGPMALSAAMAGATAVRWIDDPVVGDRIGAVTALGPAKGVPTRRAYAELNLLPSAHGLAIEPRADDLVVEADRDLVRILRPRGLALSGGAVRKPAAADLPARAAMPGVINRGWAETGDAGFVRRQEQLLAAAAAEASDGARTDARMGLARFLIANELLHEGLGVLEALRRKQPAVMNDPDFRGLRGAARASLRRFKEAGADFASPVLAHDPSSALWRGLIASGEGDHQRALSELAAGAPAMGLASPRLRGGFVAAEAQSALAMGDLTRARAALSKAGGVTGLDAAPLNLVRAKVLEAGGDGPGALKLYDALARSAPGAVGAEAELRATRLKHALGGLDAAGAVQVYNALRWRWRGDEVELETLRTLGDLYLRAGRHRQALSVFHAAGPRLSGSPTGVALQNEMTAVFRRLFLEGEADGMEPVQALALFSDFRDLTPVGADGDAMTRRMAQRLVAVDLLPQAAELLKHQAEQRLDGVARAQVATDLALVHLMDRNPEAALSALATSRTTVLPTALNLERRVIQARALVALGRLDHALEVIGTDASPDAQAVKAEIYWGQGAWPAAASTLERSLAGSGGALSQAQEARLLKAAVAYSLAGDGGGLARLRGRFGGSVDRARNPGALRVALAGLNEDGSNAADLTRIVSEADAFAGWVGEMKRRFREKPATLAPPQQALAPAPPVAGA